MRTEIAGAGGREGVDGKTGRALSVSANSSALSNSMHVLMKHCWPAAHCQRHCCIDDWSVDRRAPGLLYENQPLPLALA